MVVVSATLLAALAVVAFFLMRKYGEEKEVGDLLTGVGAEVLSWNPASGELKVRIKRSFLYLCSLAFLQSFQQPIDLSTFEFALPKAHHLPTIPPQHCVCALVALSIALDLPLPEIPVGLRRILYAGVPVPEAAVGEHGDLQLWEGYVRIGS